jgi:cell division protein FtsB
MRATTVTVLLIALLALVHAELWFGKGGLPHVVSLRAQVAEQQQKNQAAEQHNAQLSAEVKDLQGGLEMVEEKARSELGMVKPDEILVQIAPGVPAASAPPAPAASH